ncbi:MAG: hypothetical protein RSB10_03985 [Clostridia bacterium]
MNKFLQLTKFNISYYLKPRFENKKAKNKYIGMLCLFGACFISPIAMICYFLFVMVGELAKSGQTANLMSMIFLACQIMVIVFGGMKYLQVMFFAKDGEILSTLPISSNTIFLSKLLTSYISELIFSACTVLPVCIISAIALSINGVAVGAIFYILMIFAVFLLPILPIMIMSIVAVPIVKIMTFFKKRPLLGSIVTVALTIGIVAAIYIPIFSMQNQIPDTTNPDLIIEMFAPILFVGKYSIHTFALANAMLGVSVATNCLIFLAINIAALALAVGLSMLFYKSISYAMLDNAGAKIKVGKEKLQMKPMIAYAKAELKNIFRDQALAVQVLMSLIMPAFMIGIFIFVFGKMPSNPEEPLDMSGMIVGFSIFFTMAMVPGSNMLATIGFSKEGEKFYLLKTLPLDSRGIVKLKMLVADIFSLVALAICSVVFAFSKIQWYDKILFFVMQAPYVMSLNMFSLKSDIKNPKLNWVTLKEITKQKFSSVVPMLVSLAPSMIVMVVGMVLAIGASEMHPALRSTILWGVVGLIDIIVYFVFRFKKAATCVEYFDNVEA